THALEERGGVMTPFAAAAIQQDRLCPVKSADLAEKAFFLKHIIVHSSLNMAFPVFFSGTDIDELWLGDTIDFLCKRSRWNDPDAVGFLRLYVNTEQHQDQYWS